MTRPLLRNARHMAGRVPRVFITDGLDQYRMAFKKVSRTKGLGSIHIRGIHIQNLICNTNKQERLNCELAGHFMYARGINKEETLIFRMATPPQLHQAARGHRRSDARRGRRHPHTRY